MYKIVTSVLLAGIITFLSSCSINDEPYVTFKYDNERVITANTISVSLDSTFELYVDIGFDKEKGEDNMIYYEQQIGDETVDLTSTNILEMLAIDTYHNLTLEQAKITLSFSKDVVQSGSEVKIIIRDKWILQKALIFKVQ